MIDVLGPLDPEEVRAGLFSEFDTLLEVAEGLDEWEFGLPTGCVGWDVRDVLAHCYGTEAMLFGMDPPPAVEVVPGYVRNPLGEMNEPWVQLFRQGPASVVVQSLREIFEKRAHQLETMSMDEYQAETRTPKGKGPYISFVALRIFDLWMHEIDIRRAVGRPGSEGTLGALWAYSEVGSAMGFVAGKRAGLLDGQSIEFVIEDAPDGAGGFRMESVDGRATVVPRSGPADVDVFSDFVTFMGAVGG
ncbi:MAG: maleylpyruvate isomerase family mycothiol-dependent enzyme, partial [Acidimicrobiales bacterium]